VDQTGRNHERAEQRDNSLFGEDSKLHWLAHHLPDAAVLPWQGVATPERAARGEAAVKAELQTKPHDSVVVESVLSAGEKQ
jgi:hypothetical protein